MFLAHLEKLDIYSNLLIMIKPDSNQCILQGGQSDVMLYHQSELFRYYKYIRTFYNGKRK